MWFKIIIIIVAAATIGVSIANIIYYNRIRSSNSTVISHNEAVTMLWINIILIVFAAVIFIWAIWRLIFPHIIICDTPVAPVAPVSDDNNKPTHYLVHHPDDDGGTTHIVPAGPILGTTTSQNLSANVLDVSTPADMKMLANYG